jgi:hypothetical protein
MSYGGWEPPVQQDPPRSSSRRGAIWIGLAVCAAVLLVVALVNASRTRRVADRVVQPPPGPAQSQPQTGSPTPGPSGSGGGGPGPRAPGGVIPAVRCPQIRDEESHLGYTCIDDYLVQGPPDGYLGIRIALIHEVESGWVISEGSGNPSSVTANPNTTVVSDRHAAPPLPSVVKAAMATPAAVSAEVHRRTDLAMVNAYGVGPSARTLGEHPRSFAGVPGYELVTDVTINPAYRASRNLHVKTERLWVVGLPTAAGISIFMLSVPDSRSDLWPKAEATVGTVHVI